MIAIRQNGTEWMSQADLCRLTGVGKSRLHQAFAEIHGVSPGQFIYRRRLTNAHQSLLAAVDHSHLIKEVAIEHGFISSGQFARAYRAMFGEYPSETNAS